MGDRQSWVKAGQENPSAQKKERYDRQQDRCPVYKQPLPNWQCEAGVVDSRQTAYETVLDKGKGSAFFSE